MFLNCFSQFKSQPKNKSARKPVGGGSTGEEIPSDDEDIIDGKVEDVTSSEEEEETAQEKRLKLAKIYLEEIETEGIFYHALALSFFLSINIILQNVRIRGSLLILLYVMRHHHWNQRNYTDIMKLTV